MPTPIVPEITKAVGQRSPATEKAIKWLLQGKPGDTITRAQAASFLGVDCSPAAGGDRSMTSACKATEKEHQIVWEWKRDEQNWRCLTAAETMVFQGKKLRRSRNAAKRAVIVGVAVDQKQLSEEERRDHNLQCTLVGMVYMALSPPARKHLTEVAGRGKLAEPSVAAMTALLTKAE